jgi:carbamoyl-phosphate synthase large subunit
MTRTYTGDRPFTVLISAAGRRVSLLRSFRDALAAVNLPGRVIATDLTMLSSAMQIADECFTVPRCTDPSFPDEMLRLCHRENVDLVVPTIDTELPVWARLQPQIEAAGTTVAVSSPSAIDIAADKRKTNAHCAASGIPVPKQGTLGEVDRMRRNWSLPLVVKPARGSSSVGLHIVRSWSEFDRILELDGEDLIVESFLPGLEHTVDVLVDRSGNVHCPVVRRRLEVRAGEVSKARVVKDDGLASLAVKVVETLPDAYGVLNVQMFSDGISSGVVEINARFGGGYPLTWRAGGRYSEWLVREVAWHEKPPVEPQLDYHLTMLRWDDEVFVRA